MIGLGLFGGFCLFIKKKKEKLATKTWIEKQKQKTKKNIMNKSKKQYVNIGKDNDKILSKKYYCWWLI